ncbi:LysR family transcriptional regulator [Cohnella cholangitidis]|uniref:LysR family transcriptional regulator n=1 Tax=Cohnella cholangitidis TaxID=2598458 RepID=A0A7G5BVS5_9BACL|nr:LysR family transcriptional regulator [Cohnella cholangitidis]QMV41059.1 LysR family transcriptional regulator [Cohnella cholangitidis]
MDLIYMRSFLEVARCQSFTKAAENLGYVQSSVTAQIQKLENEYGVVLFERYGRTIRLTSAGEQLQDSFEQILKIYDDSKRLVARQAKGSLEIGTIESLMAFYLPPLFHRFLQSFPDINLQANPLVESAILQSVRNGQLDLGIVMDLPITDNDIESIIIREEPLVLVAKPEHPLCSADRVDVSQLDGQFLITTEQGCTYRAAFERLLGTHGVTYHIHHEFGSLEAIKQCVSYGLGIALVPRIAVTRELAEQRLVALPFAHPDITFYTQIVHHKKKWLNPAIRHLIELLAETDEMGQPTDSSDRQTSRIGK